MTVTVPDWARPTLSWLTRRFLDAELPPAAVEVRAGALGVVRVVRDKRAASLGAATSLELAAGTLKLSMAERIALQKKLSELGYPVRNFTGHFDFDLRDAVRDVQVKAGQVPDGHPTPALLSYAGMAVK